MHRQEGAPGFTCLHSKWIQAGYESDLGTSHPCLFSAMSTTPCVEWGPVRLTALFGGFCPQHRSECSPLPLVWSVGGQVMMLRNPVQSVSTGRTPGLDYGL